MKTNMKLLKSLPLVAATAAAMGLANPAHADAYAVSAANITDLIIITNPNTLILPGTPESEATASLNGVSETSATLTDAAAVNAPGSNPANTRLNNVFNQFGQTNANYSNADAVIDSQQTAGAAFTQVRDIGESFGVGDVIGTTTTKNGSNTGFRLQVTENGTIISFNFNAFKYLQAALTADATIPGSSAAADIDVELTITDLLGNTIFSWNPDGSVNQNITGSVGGTETADAFSLNGGVSTVFPGSSPTQTSAAGCMITAANMALGTGVGNACMGNFAAATNGIAAGDYNLTLTIKTSTRISSVPVPGTLALMGLGLLGAGYSASRRRSKTA